MRIDLHFHTKQFSQCSRIDIEEGILKAKNLGLNGICITDHDVFADRDLAKKLSDKHDILIVVGTEILTSEGDILCYGLKELPPKSISAQELINYVNKRGGACIAAHPYRQNNRGLGEKIHFLNGLHAIESFNGNTDENGNFLAKKTALSLGIPQTGGSDAHDIEKIGIYSTVFNRKITSEEDLVIALRSGDFSPYMSY